jgi:hypothetical protein
MESVQHHDNDEVARDRRDQLLRHLAGELRRWLLSLEHDEDATDSAIGLVEYAHLRLQHGQQLQLSRIPPLPVEGADTEEAETAEEASIGQWYRFEDSEGELRGAVGAAAGERSPPAVRELRRPEGPGPLRRGLPPAPRGRFRASPALRFEFQPVPGRRGGDRQRKRLAPARRSQLPPAGRGPE